jgi:hypothetical protein
MSEEVFTHTLPPREGGIRGRTPSGIWFSRYSFVEDVPGEGPRTEYVVELLDAEVYSSLSEEEIRDLSLKEKYYGFLREKVTDKARYDYLVDEFITKDGLRAFVKENNL